MLRSLVGSEMCIRDRLRPLVRAMTAEAARTVAAAFISCRLEYCNSLVYGLPDTLLHKFCVERHHTTVNRARDTVIILLHRLPIRERVKFKIARLVRQSLFRQAPLYLADDCCFVPDSTRRSLRSADVPTCVVPRTEHSAVTATELLQLLYLACGTPFRSSCAI